MPAARTRPPAAKAKAKAAPKAKAKAPARPAPAGTKHRIYSMSVASVYPHYVAKAAKKARTKAEVDEVIRWLTGFTQRQLDAHLEARTDFETFFAKAKLNPSRRLITGVVCGVDVAAIEDPLMQNIRYLDKLVDELAKGKPLDKILRKPDAKG